MQISFPYNLQDGTVAFATQVMGNLNALKDAINAGLQSDNIEDLAVTTAKIADLAITTVKIAEAAITESKLADSSVTTNKIADLAVTTLKLADACITNAKMAIDSVDTSNIVNLAITTEKLNDLAVTTTKLADAVITESKLGNLSVSTGKIQDLAVTTEKLADLSVTTSKLANGAVINAKLATGAVATTNIQDGAVSTIKIQNEAVTVDKLHPDVAALAGDAELKNQLLNEEYTPPVTETSSIIQLPSTTVKGQVSVELGGNTRTNLVPTFDSGEWTIHANATINSPTKLTLNADGSYQYSLVRIKLIEGKTYTKSGIVTSGAQIYIRFLDGSGTQISITTNETFTVPSGTVDTEIRLQNTSSTGTYTFEDIMIEEGTEVKSFITGTKSTFSDSGDSIVSVGKNLVPNFYDSDWIINSHVTIQDKNTIQIKASTSAFSEAGHILINLKPNTQYTLSGICQSGAEVDVLVKDKAGDIVLDSASVKSTISSVTFTTPSNGIIGYIRPHTYTTDTVTISNIQLEYGGTATTYEPYQSSVIYPSVLRSLPNGVQDEVNNAGEFVQRTKEYVLQSGDVTSLVTSNTNNDIVVLSYANISDIKDNGVTDTVGTKMLTDRTTPRNSKIFDSTDNVWTHSFDASGWYVFVPKGTYADLASAQADLAGTTLIYQLATPEITEGAVTPLTVFENGTLIVNSTVLPEITWSVPVNTKAQINSNTDGINALSKKVKGNADNLDTHLADKANPHQVKAEQVFALGGVPAGTAFPTSPVSYTLFFRTDLNKLFVYLP